MGTETKSLTREPGLAEPRMERWRVVCRNMPTFYMRIAETDHRPLAECARAAVGREYLDIVRFEPVNDVAREVVPR